MIISERRSLQGVLSKSESESVRPNACSAAIASVSDRNACVYKKIFQCVIIDKAFWNIMISQVSQESDGSTYLKINGGLLLTKCTEPTRWHVC